MKAGCLKASNRRPPPIDPDKPIPDAAFGPYVFHKYHRNHQGKGMGYSGSMSESQAAYNEFEEKQKALEAIAMPILQKMAGAGGAGGMPDMGGMGGGMPDMGGMGGAPAEEDPSGGPTIEEID